MLFYVLVIVGWPFSTRRSCFAVRDLQVSVIIPVRDESSNVEPICEAFAKLLKTDPSVSEVIFVEDHSRDATLDQIELCSTNFSFVKSVIQNDQRGKGAAIKSGFQKARGDVLVMMDGDLQYSPLEIPRLLEPILTGSADLVVGRGSNQHSSVVRRVLSKSFQAIFTWMFRLPVSSPQEGFKAIVKAKFEELGVIADGFDFDIELLVKANRHLLRITEVPVERRERFAGKSKVDVFPTVARFCSRMARLWFSQRKSR